MFTYTYVCIHKYVDTHTHTPMNSQAVYGTHNGSKTHMYVCMHIKYTYIRTNKHTHTQTRRPRSSSWWHENWMHNIYIYVCISNINTYTRTNTHTHADRRAAVDGTRNSCKTSGRSAGTQPKIGRERPLQLDAYMWTHKCTFTRTLM